MVTKYYKYIPWLILGAIGSYESATYFGHSTFDILYLSIVFMIVYVALFILLMSIFAIYNDNEGNNAWIGIVIIKIKILNGDVFHR